MGYNSFLRSPKKVEQLAPKNGRVSKFSCKDEDIDIVEELEKLLGIDENERNFQTEVFNWDFMDWQEGDEEQKFDILHEWASEKENYEMGFWENDENKISLKLNLNYQDVLDAWSDRGPLLADECSFTLASNGHHYMGEVQVMEEERSRRAASVLRYKEKRQNRLFSKKIRYQVRKLNADKRPRFKGRFAKGVHEKIWCYELQKVSHKIS